MRQKYIPGYFFALVFCCLLSLKLSAQQVPAVATATSARQFNITSANTHVPAGAIEDTALRTSYSSFWHLGNKVYACYSASPINYKDANGKLVPVKIALKNNSDGWEALQQPNPCYFKSDRSTAISIGNSQEIGFNINTAVDGVPYDEQLVSVGETRVSLNLAPAIHKYIDFINNGIESSYTFDKALDNGISVTEQVSLPAGCTFAPDKKTGGEKGGGWAGDYVVRSADGKVLARFIAPTCVDAAKHIGMAIYKVEVKDGKYFLTTDIPSDWLKTAKYPVILDPRVMGPIAMEVGDKLKPSCEVPSYSSDSLLVTIPGKITITQLSIDYSYTTVNTISEVQDMNIGRFYFSTSCGSSPVLYCDSAYPGTCYLIPNNDFHSWLTCCYSPLCTPQTFWLVAHLGRTVFSGCPDTTIVWHDEKDTYPFNYQAFIVGYTDSILNWSVTPTTQCSNSCNLTLNASLGYGVPPYTVSHPWATIKDTVVGRYAGCESVGGLALKLKIPGCPFTCGHNDTLFVPPPLVIDACNDTVKNVSPKTIEIILKPVPVISASPDTIRICNGTPVDITLNSCVPGTVFSWNGSDKSSGSSSPINYTPTNSGNSTITITYTATAVANGCKAADTIKAVSYVNPVPTVTTGGSATITQGNSDTLHATGGGTYSWAPSNSLNCPTCANPVATPSVTTMYTVTVTDSGGCSTIDSVLVIVKEVAPPITIPNIITPNNDGKNDQFVIQNLQYYPNSQITIYDRWGVVVYSSGNYPNNWDGGSQSDGVYYYLLVLPNGKKYKGFIQLIR